MCICTIIIFIWILFRHLSVESSSEDCTILRINKKYQIISVLFFFFFLKVGNSTCLAIFPVTKSIFQAIKSIFEIIFHSKRSPFERNFTIIFTLIAKSNFTLSYSNKNHFLKFTFDILKPNTNQFF